jgi:serine/threonine-protein kinase RsbW
MTQEVTTSQATIPSEFSEGHRVIDEIMTAVASHSFGDRDVFAIRLALEEAIVNAIKHGNQMEPEKKVQINYTVSSEEFQIRIEDEGIGFNPKELPDPTAVENLEKHCGRGVMIIRGFMTSVDYHGRGNVVVMTKKKSPPDTEENEEDDDD